MKILIALIVLCAVAFAAPADKTKSKKKPAAAAKTAPAMLVIPKDAVQNPDGTYAYTDKQGKKWLYKNSPFGVMRTTDTGVAAAAGPSQAQSQFVKATDAGDTVKFERPSPFGTTKWEKKKADLTDEERSLLQEQAPQSQTPAQPKAEQQP